MSKEKDLLIYKPTMLGDENDYDAPEVERIQGTYKGSEFILDRIYEDEYEDDDGETAYESFRWEFANTEHIPMDENGEEVDIDIIVDLYNYMDYSRIKR